MSKLNNIKKIILFSGGLIAFTASLEVLVFSLVPGKTSKVLALLIKFYPWIEELFTLKPIGPTMPRDELIKKQAELLEKLRTFLLEHFS